MTLVDQWITRFEAFALEWQQASRIVVPAEWFEEFEAAIEARERLVRAGQWGIGPRSLLGVLGERHLETRHTVILAWLLDPLGRHGLGSRLAARFLASAVPERPLACEQLRCTTEELCATYGGNVDIVMRGAGWRVVVEAKIWAGPSGDQLDRYYDEFLDDQTYFVYLTREGTRAYSRRDEVARGYRPLSWRKDVLPALRDAINESMIGCTESSQLCAARDYLAALEEELG